VDNGPGGREVGEGGARVIVTGSPAVKIEGPATGSGGHEVGGGRPVAPVKAGRPDGAGGHEVGGRGKGA
jgi:hypothetical protein